MECGVRSAARVECRGVTSVKCSVECGWSEESKV